MSDYDIHDRLSILWAKTTQDKTKFPNAYHPLLFHMIDVAAVAGMVWDHCLFAGLSQQNRVFAIKARTRRSHFSCRGT